MKEKNKCPISKNEFVGLHAHSGFSLYDGMSLPQEHINFAVENGSKALALTDHGHCNGLSYQFLHSQKLKKEGKKFKPIFGVEAYFTHSLPKWKELHEHVKEFDKKLKKQEEETAGIVIEDENATKTMTKFDCLSLEENRLYRRSHLVILAQNQIGLNNLFALVSKSYKPENFFRFPRIDLEMLKEHNDGLILSSACLGGIYANDFWTYRSEGDDAVYSAMKETTKAFQDIFGDRFYGELQWNRMPEQHQVNKHILALKGEMGLPVISTADSHYPRPELWKDRELYKRLRPGIGNLNGELPQSLDELGYELYPKNAEQMWDSFVRYSQINGEVYDTEDIIESFRNTTDIAFNRIEDFELDTSVKLPSFIISKGKTAEEEFEEKCWEGLKAKGLDKNETYVNQLQTEIDVITERGFASYFLTMKALVDKAWENHLVGSGRGCFISGTRVKMSDGFYSSIETIQKGDEIIDAFGKKQEVLDTYQYNIDEEIIELDFGDGVVVECTKDHEFYTENRGWVEAQFLSEEDEVVEV